MRSAEHNEFEAEEIVMHMKSQKFASTLPIKRKYTFKGTEKTNESSPPRALTLTVEEVRDIGNESQILEL